GQLEKIVASVDLDGNGLISHKEMKAILQDKDAVRALHSVGVDPVSLVDLADVLFPTKVA
ncbi:Scn11a, partial [Symbiodinium necroappetens]